MCFTVLVFFILKWCLACSCAWVKLLCLQGSSVTPTYIISFFSEILSMVVSYTKFIYIYIYIYIYMCVCVCVCVCVCLYVCVNVVYIYIYTCIYIYIYIYMYIYIKICSVKDHGLFPYQNIQVKTIKSLFFLYLCQDGEENTPY